MSKVLLSRNDMEVFFAVLQDLEPPLVTSNTMGYTMSESQRLRMLADIEEKKEDRIEAFKKLVERLRQDVFKKQLSANK